MKNLHLLKANLLDVATHVICSAKLMATYSPIVTHMFNVVKHMLQNTFYML